MDVFHALIKPLCDYNKAVWTLSKASGKKITASLNRMLRAIAGCSRLCSTDVLYKCMKTSHPQLYDDYFKLLFKFNRNDKAKGSFHHNYLDDIREQCSGTKYSKAHHKFRLDGSENMKSNDLIHHLRGKYFCERNTRVQSNPKLCDEVKDWLYDVKTEVDPNWHISNYIHDRDLGFMIDTIGYGNPLGSNNRLCHRCSEINSLEHACMTCNELLVTCDITELLTSTDKTKVDQNVSNMRLIWKSYTESREDMPRTTTGDK